jgi:hypothetical protein
MTNEDKARHMMDAAEEVGKQYDREGRVRIAKLHREAFAQLPIGSLARLYDIFTKPKGDA